MRKRNSCRKTQSGSRLMSCGSHPIIGIWWGYGDSSAVREAVDPNGPHNARWRGGVGSYFCRSHRRQVIVGPRDPLRRASYRVIFIRPMIPARWKTPA